MKVYDDTKPLYLEIDASAVGLSAALLQMHVGKACQKDIAPDNTNLQPIVFASKSLTGAEHRYSNIEREVLGILPGPIKDMDIRIDVIQSVTDILECISIPQIQQASVQDKHLQCLKSI